MALGHPEWTSRTSSADLWPPHSPILDAAKPMRSGRQAPSVHLQDFVFSIGLFVFDPQRWPGDRQRSLPRKQCCCAGTECFVFFTECFVFSTERFFGTTEHFVGTTECFVCFTKPRRFSTERCRLGREGWLFSLGRGGLFALELGQKDVGTAQGGDAAGAKVGELIEMAGDPEVALGIGDDIVGAIGGGAAKLTDKELATAAIKLDDVGVLGAEGVDEQVVVEKEAGVEGAGDGDTAVGIAGQTKDKLGAAAADALGPDLTPVDGAELADDGVGAAVGGKNGTAEGKVLVEHGGDKDVAHGVEGEGRIEGAATGTPAAGPLVEAGGVEARDQDVIGRGRKQRAAEVGLKREIAREDDIAIGGDLDGAAGIDVGAAETLGPLRKARGRELEQVAIGIAAAGVHADTKVGGG